jgi:hypothetical protein
VSDVDIASKKAKEYADHKMAKSINNFESASLETIINKIKS